jgi:hypothetical protein
MFGNRTYSSKTINGIRKKVVVTWMQNRCKDCGKFLSKKGIRWCVGCAKKKLSFNVSNYNKRNREKINKRENGYYKNNINFRTYRDTKNVIYRNPDRFNIGDYL